MNSRVLQDSVDFNMSRFLNFSRAAAYFVYTHAQDTFIQIAQLDNTYIYARVYSRQVHFWSVQIELSVRVLAFVTHLVTNRLTNLRGFRFTVQK